ncbi:MAG: hypothetical protein DHS20C11_14960 [Lysobacteraceae bacterium]|nr:MAG: hypothetical protein DHS20C11_14960 [Xanthomonadaceae bacterium]
MRDILYVNPYVATGGRLGTLQLPEPYVLAARFFFCGMIDRTGTLDTGFPYRVMDPIPKATNSPLTFEDISDAIGEELIDRALTDNKEIQVLWSGGIDSTLVLIALLKAAERRGKTDLIEVVLTIDSIQEYSEFYAQHIHNRLRIRPVAHPVFGYLDDDKIIVTGEHGDQLFGSDYLAKFVPTGTAWLPYKDVLPLIITGKLGDPDQADVVMDYLRPQIAKAPVLIETVFDLFWWLNFSLKWQHVTFRTVIYRRKNHRKTYDTLCHFFRDPRFQNWSLTNRDKVIGGDWDSYKYVAKQYIFDYTNDERYFRHKRKEVSLWGYSQETERNWGRLREAIYMFDDFHPHHDVYALKDDWEH